MKPLLLLVFLLVGITLNAQNAPHTLNPEMYRTGYDIPAGVDHGTWDFDEWPGVDHPVVYVRDFMYGEPGEKIKIDYTLSVFDSDDHTGYLRTPEALSQRFTDMESVLSRAQRILVIMAHPDDEILLTGGILARAAAMGKKVRVILVSNGADGSQGFKEEEDAGLRGYNCAGIMPNGSIRVTTDLMGLRKPLLARIYGLFLGVTIELLPVRFELDGKSVIQIGEYMGLDFKKSFGPGTVMREAIEQSIDNLLQRENPDIVITHGTNGEYGSYFHKMVHQVVKNTVIHHRDRMKTRLFTGFPEYNYNDSITHFLDLDGSGGDARRRKHEAFKKITFIYKEGNDYDKPWNPNDDLMDGVFVKDYGYTPVAGKPPRYEFFQEIEIGAGR
ncbi:MAG: PIG-L family deacetylase [Bacteroidetes bacterium]|nr:PIG-L family deacetylase [Bacteroidota bacterium]